MGICKKTKPSFLWIQLTDNAKHLGFMRKKNKEESFDDKWSNCLLLTNETHSFQPDEYYFNEEDKEIVFHGTLESPHGKGYIGIDIPLPDTMLLDILGYAFKKFNKLKNVMENLK